MSHRTWSALAAAVAVSICSGNLASASMLPVDGGILQYWELEAELPAERPTDAEPTQTENVGAQRGG